MILVDTALAARAAEGRPIRVGLLGAGFMTQGLTNCIQNSVPGMRVVAIYNRDAERARKVYEYSGATKVVLADTQVKLEDAIRAGTPAVTETPSCWRVRNRLT